ncbi:MAG: hypothetical protein JST93_01425 [Acidobacteria bacterium]|nr:hypothetical protein [Acidobacteriota bacterium]
MRDFEVINENLRHALAAFSYVREGGETEYDDGLSLVYSGVPYGLFNTALITARLPSAEMNFHQQVERAEEFFARRAVPWSVWFCDEMLAPEERRRARIALATRGLRYTMDAPGMIAPELLDPARELPVLRYVRVGNETTRNHFSEVMSAAFRVPMDVSKTVYGGRTMWHSPMVGWLGYLGNEPVTTAAVVSSPDAVGLYAVATVPHHQRKGYAEAIARFAIEEVGTGQTVLQSSNAGYPLYVRMGYRPVSRYFVYIKS